MTMTTPSPTHFDIAIIGGGPVGLALANWLLRDSDWRIALIDAGEPTRAAADPRALALAHGSQQLLENLGAWPQQTAPIRTIHVSQRGHFGRAVLRAADEGVPSLGAVVRYGDLVAALIAALSARAGSQLTWLTQTRATANGDPHRHPIAVELDGAQAPSAITASCVIHAEGGLFAQQAPKGRQRDYRQHALVTTIRCPQAPADWAWERFTDEGPVAILPFRQSGADTFALVWCGSPEATSRRLALEDGAFVTALQQAFGPRAGPIVATGPRAAFALGINAATTQVVGRTVAIGNAAQTLHPVAGQGFNLGLRDAAQLAQAIAMRLDDDALAAFAAGRSLDRGLTIGITDTLPRLFAFEGFGIPHWRGAALTLVDLLPALKTRLARQMMFGLRR